MPSNASPPTILALVAQPLINAAGQPQARLDIEGEVRQLCERLGDLQRAAELHVAIATPDNLLRLLTRCRFDILHFSGHGGQGLLAFEDGRGGIYPLTPEQLRRLLLPGGQIPFHLAFLSACHSASLAEALAEAGVPHVVAIDCARPVLDAAATAFARAFYPALLSRRPLAEAFEIGRVAVNTDATLHRLSLALNQKNLAALEETKFLLLPQDGQHTAPLFSDLPPGELAYVAPQITPHNLVARPSTFTGREQELHTLVNHVLDYRLTTVTGMGGMGKTELAREAGRWLAERCFFPQGITFVELRGLTEAVAARARIAAALQLPVERMVSDQALASALHGQEHLLILDDLDEVVNCDRRGMRALLKTLLDQAEPLHLLLTSREAPRGLPEKLYPLLRLKPDEAARLFLTWAGLSRDDLPGTLDELMTVLNFLDGYPLAIVLAAPLLAGYSLAELLRQLQQAQEQTLADPTLSPEEQDQSASVTFSLELSYRHLQKSNPAAADFFPLLALFPAGAEETALEEVLGAGWAEALARLRAVSLVEMLPGGRVRLPTQQVQAYAERHLPADDRDRYGPAALDYYRKLIEAIEAPLSTLYTAVLTAELPNVHFWLNWGYSHETPVNGQSYSARLTAALRNYYMLTNWPPEAEANFQCALQAARQAGDRWSEANTLQAIGDVQRFRDEYDAALASYAQALDLFQAVSDRLGEANTRKAIGDVHNFRKELDAALASYAQALDLFQTVGDRLGEANTRQAIGDMHNFRQELDAALASYAQALDLFQAVGSRLGEANTLKAIGDVHNFRKELDAALASYAQALDLFQAVGDRLGEANALKAIGDIQQFHKEPDAALASYAQALDLFQAVGSRLGEANTLKAIGEVQQFRKEIDAALDSYQKALALFRQIGDRLGEANTLVALAPFSENADEMFEIALSLYKAIGDQYSTARGLFYYARFLASKGELDQAIAALEQCRNKFMAINLTDHAAAAQMQIAESVFSLAQKYEVKGDISREVKKPQTLGKPNESIEQYQAAIKWFAKAKKLYADLGKAEASAFAALSIGRCLVKGGAWHRGLEMLRHEVLPAFRTLDNPKGKAQTFQQIGIVHQLMGDYELAEMDYRDAVRHYRQAGDNLGIATTKVSLGQLAIQMQELDKAIAILSEALPVLRSENGTQLERAKRLLDLAQEVKQRQAVLA